MKKFLYIAAFAALALNACTNEEDRIFDQSAADRLEQYKKDYADVLTSGNGLWSMEYFSNEEEPGYVFVMKFDKNGSVEISANHKWIGGSFKQETSLWKMIADNGPVLSFNSYNNLFHIFSDPANILGDNAPKDDYGDIDETGFGHEGDYEFQVMEVSEDHNTMRMLGKKRLYDIYLRRLPEGTTPEEFLSETAAIPSRFSKKFNDLVLTAEDGEQFRLNNMHTAIPSIYPLAGDAVMQTVEANGIFTTSGFRFLRPLEVKRADDTTLEIQELFFNADGSLSGEGVADLRCKSALENVIRPDLTWTLDPASLTGKVKALYDAANDAAIAQLGAKNALGAIDLAYGMVNNESVPQLVTRIGTKILRDYITYTYEKDEYGNVVASDKLHFSIFGKNNTSEKYDEQIPEYFKLKEYLCGNFVLTVNNVLVPDVITVTDVSDPASSFTIKAK